MTCTHNACFTKFVDGQRVLVCCHCMAVVEKPQETVEWAPVQCGACGGSGFRDEAGTICPTCDGTGLMYLPRGE